MGSLCSRQAPPPPPHGEAYSASVRVAADADTMWSILSDLQASAHAVEAVQSFAYVVGVDENESSSPGKQQSYSSSYNSNDTKFAVGTIVKEIRVYNGKTYTCRRQIVDIVDSSAAAAAAAAAAADDMNEQQQQQPQFRSVSFSTMTDASRISRHVTNTSTLTVVAVPLPDTNNNSITTRTNNTNENIDTSGGSCSCELVGTMAFSSSGNVFFSILVSCYKLCRNFKPDPYFQKELEDLAAAAEARMAAKQ
jgi:hypothetical protein